MTEFITRKYGNEGYEVIIKTDSEEHYKAAEDFARRLIDHEKPVTVNNVGCKWIPAKERLPKENQQVLCLRRNGRFWAAYWTYIDWMWYDDCEWHIEREVTHWMPIPEPPKEV